MLTRPLGHRLAAAAWAQVLGVEETEAGLVWA